MSTYGVGQGLERGVALAARIVLPVALQNKQYYDALAVQQGWQEGWGPESKIAALPQAPQEGQAGSSSTMNEPTQVGRLSVPGSPVAVSQPPRPMSPAQALAFSTGVPHPPHPDMGMPVPYPSNRPYRLKRF